MMAAASSHAPDRPFSSDGCTLFPEGRWGGCCVEHDRAYWAGGSYGDRLAADRRLRACVANRGYPAIAWLMFVGVRLCGAAFWPTPWRWGYRRRHPVEKGTQAVQGYRTIIANVLMLALGWLGFSLEPEMVQELTGALITIVTVVNMLLRMITTGPVGKRMDAMTKSFARTTPVLMAVLMAVALAGPLTACASAQADTPAQKVAAARADLNVALSTAAVTLQGGNVSDEVKAAVKGLAESAVAAVDQADAVLSAGGGDVAVSAALAGAATALAQLSAWLTAHYTGEASQ